jgi:hypothetical protein
MWGEAVYNLIGFGKQSDDGDNIVDENSGFLLLDEADGTAITEDLSVNWGGFGLAYDNSWFGQTKYER